MVAFWFLPTSSYLPTNIWHIFFLLPWCYDSQSTNSNTKYLGKISHSFAYAHWVRRQGGAPSILASLQTLVKRNRSILHCTDFNVYKKPSPWLLFVFFTVPPVNTTIILVSHIHHSSADPLLIQRRADCHNGRYEQSYSPWSGRRYGACPERPVDRWWDCLISICT